MKKWLLCLASAAVFSGAQGAEHGSFQGKVMVEWLDEPFVPAMRLVEDFGFRQANGKVWKVSRGQIIDGRGLPPLLRDLVGSPYEGGFRKSAVIYESATQRMSENWRAAQRMFFEASVVEGVAPLEAKVMYLLLVIQGSRWEVPGSHCFGSCHGVSEPLQWRPVIDEVRTAELMKWVRAADPQLEEIDLRGQAAIRALGPHIFMLPACNEFSGSTRIRKSCD